MPVAAPTHPRRTAAPDYDTRATAVPFPLLLDVRREGVPMGLARRAKLRDAKRGLVRKEAAA